MVIGKDITYFHTLFWPAMLAGAGYNLPSAVVVHGFLTVNGAKMSKSAGTFVNARTFLRVINPELLRYYFATKLTAKPEDLDFNVQNFVDKINSDLVHNLANIPSRVGRQLQTHFGGRTQELDDAGRALIRDVANLMGEIEDSYETVNLTKAMELVRSQCTIINQFLETTTPWVSVRTDSVRAGRDLTAALSAYRLVATAISPTMPKFASKVAQLLNLGRLDWSSADEPLENHQIEEYQPLLERISVSDLKSILVED